MMCYYFDEFDVMFIRFNGGCFRNFTHLNPCGDFNAYPIVEPYYHCEPGLFLPLVFALLGLFVFYRMLRYVGFGKTTVAGQTGASEPFKYPCHPLAYYTTRPLIRALHLPLYWRGMYLPHALLMPIFLVWYLIGIVVFIIFGGVAQLLNLDNELWGIWFNER